MEWKRPAGTTRWTQLSPGSCLYPMTFPQPALDLSGDYGPVTWTTAFLRGLPSASAPSGSGSLGPERSRRPLISVLNHGTAPSPALPFLGLSCPSAPAACGGRSCFILFVPRSRVQGERTAYGLKFVLVVMGEHVLLALHCRNGRQHGTHSRRPDWCAGQFLGKTKDDPARPPLGLCSHWTPVCAKPLPRI